MFQALSQIPETFGELAQHIFAQPPNSTRVDFVTDTYQQQSIKNIERERRGTSQDFLIHGHLTRVPSNYKQFLANSSWQTVPTKQLIRLILDEWKEGQVCTEAKRTTGDEEADTRIILHCCHIATQCAPSAIMVRLPDTDVFLLKFSQNISIPLIMDTGVADKRRLIDITSAVNGIDNDMCNAFLSLHAFSGCDTVSSFMRKGIKLDLYVC
ncbi:hypothetical protein HOLleu_16699 [Holothuria leucospilota]|uniref:Uncharacterized protein n=1 Tax=Holothuria leucospilota TaxID=206669 RepID=A0A9Q1H7Z8_HOLLE|nr:hypothetical protein HOLleu_16699 [Holothuria leucospilota]